jgi:glutathione S-transferase
LPIYPHQKSLNPTKSTQELPKVLKLNQPKRAFGLPNPSAFCVKLETYLRMADIPYELVHGEPTDAPKGKIPWIEDGSTILGDSSFIIEYLKNKYGDPLDSWLTSEQQALGHAIKKMLEESLYFVSSYFKWVDDKGFEIYAAELFAGMPEEQLKYVPDMVRKKVIEKLYVQGIGRHSSEEVYEIGLQDVASFAALLGDGPYLFGDRPTSFDASAFGTIGNLKDGPFPGPVRDAIRSTRNVATYITKIRQQYFADIS